MLTVIIAASVGLFRYERVGGFLCFDVADGIKKKEFLIMTSWSS